MVETVTSAALLLVAVAVLVYIIIVATWRADNDGCDETQCDTCPFPCEKHTERGAKK